MRKHPRPTIEQRIEHANQLWDKVLVDCSNGIIDREVIASAMDQLNVCHRIAIKENKRHLLF